MSIRLRPAALSLHSIAQVALLAALYFLVAKASLLAAIPPGYATSVWPPSGVALAALLLRGARLWPGVWIGAALANLTVQSSLVAAAIMATGNAVEALVAAALIHRYVALTERFERGEDVFRFVAIAAAASAVAASTGALGVAVAGTDDGSPASLASTWLTWWQGDVTGIVVVAPLILAWAAPRRLAWSPRRALETVALLVGIAVVGHLAFGSSLLVGDLAPLVLALTLPLVIWAAFRFDAREVVLTVAALAALAVGYTVAGRGPFAATELPASLWQLLAFISIVAVSGQAVGAVVGERRRAMDALRTANDTLEERVAERGREVQRTEETFRMLVDGIQDYAIFMLDPDGRIASWNRGAQKIKGYAADEIIGQHVSRFYPQEAIDRQWPQQELALARAQGRFEDEGWRLRKDGSRFWANVLITALYGSDGRLRGFAKVTRDMTERKRMEALESSERRVNEFLAMLAHELRNPLTPIRNALDLMRMRSEGRATISDEWARDIIDRQVTQLTRLVDDLLDVGRITRGKVALKKEPTDLNDAVLRAVEASNGTAQARRQALVVHASDEPLLVNGDPIRLAQVVQNLVGNAIKYTGDGGRIDVTLGRDGDWAVLRVRDNGIGIPPGLLPHVFDLFVQGERSLARTEGGLGIGLTVVRQLIALHGGTAVANSEGIGRGSEFIVVLPLLAARDGAREAIAAPAAVTVAPAAPPGVARRVLVVDDNHDAADIMASLLRSLGHVTVTAYDGAAALAAVTAQTQTFDAVFLDIGLPGMNGYEVAARMRAMPQMRGVTLVAFTGYGQRDDRERTQAAGFDRHLVKPVGGEMLQSVLDAIPARPVGVRAQAAPGGEGVSAASRPRAS